ncbi:ComEC/Rec2 family competence protein [Patescibacteria group bacterium]|nr:ComEC/Rec2 family competence protein [Patescibacteria group bacterium]
MRGSILYSFIISFVLGVALRSFFDFGLFFALFLIFLSLLLFVYYFLICTGKSRGEISLFFLISLAVLAFGLGVLRFDLADLERGEALLERQIGEEIAVVGIVFDEPDERETTTRLVVKLDTFSGKAISTKALIVTERYPAFSYGDRIAITGILEKPKNFESGMGKEFDYVSYLGKDDIFYTIAFPTVEFVSAGEGNSVKSILFNIKREFLDTVSKLIPDPQASLLGGLVVGAKQSLGTVLQDKFRKTGIIHIVVLSGYNVTIVAEAIMRFFSFLPKAAGMSLGALSIVFFAVMTGASATIVRASVMALLVILARATGRTYMITRALFLAGFFMVLHNPKIVIFDPSFQLSFLATIGLIYLAPQIEAYFKLVPTKWQLREFATATIATQLFVLPLILYMMGELSLVALPVNMLILMFVPLTMLFGFLTGVVGFVSLTLATPFAWVTHALLTYELFVVDIFSVLPFASISIQTFPLWAMLGLYFVYGAVLLKLWRRTIVSSGSSNS